MIDVCVSLLQFQSNTNMHLIYGVDIIKNIINKVIITGSDIKRTTKTCFNAKYYGTISLVNFVTLHLTNTFKILK